MVALVWKTGRQTGNGRAGTFRRCLEEACVPGLVIKWAFEMGDATLRARALARVSDRKTTNMSGGRSSLKKCPEEEESAPSSAKRPVSTDPSSSNLFLGRSAVAPTISLKPHQQDQVAFSVVASQRRRWHRLGRPRRMGHGEGEKLENKEGGRNLGGTHARVCANRATNRTLEKEQFCFEIVPALCKSSMIVPTRSNVYITGKTKCCRQTQKISR